MSRLQGVDMEPTRRYLARLGYPVDPARLVERPDQRPSTLCYLCVGGRLLMLKRRKEPFAGHWTAPGGKIQPGEDPPAAIVREMREETNLAIVDPVLRAICSEVGGNDYNWLLFIFACSAYSGELAESTEGELQWLDLAELVSWRLPDVDRRIMPYVLGEQGAPWYIRVGYAPDHSVERFDARPLAEMVG